MESELNQSTTTDRYEVLPKLWRDRLQTYQPRLQDSHGLKRSAVLALVILQPSGPHLLFTQRSPHLTHHPSQISFPGGRLDSDESGWQAALREASEEIGIDPQQVQYGGRQDDSFSPKGFHLECHVGLTAPFEPQINLAEVSSVFTVPLALILDPSLHQTKPWPFNPAISVHYFQLMGHTVWGVTGALTYHLARTILGRQD
jgi:8-oxo-dGTP pyrophosphatase MutT (NUDIX family)